MAPRGPRCMGPTDPGDSILFSDVFGMVFTHSVRETTAKDKRRVDKMKKRVGKGWGGASRSSLFLV